MDQFIFIAMRESKLIVPASGGGHIHMGIDSLIKAMDYNLENVASGAYNFLKLMYESDRFVQAFLRPDKNYAITPAMASDVGRIAVKEGFDNWLKSIETFDIKDVAQFKPWLEKHMTHATMFDFFDEVANGDAMDELSYFMDWESASNDQEYFKIYPEENIGVYGAFRYHALNQTIETRALRSQKSMAEFIELSEFLTRLLVGSTLIKPESLNIPEEFPQYQAPAAYESVRSQLYEVMKRADYGNNDQQKIARLLKILNPKLIRNCQ